MKKKLFKIFLLVLVAGMGVFLTLDKLDALGATWCRGNSDCQEVEEACYEGEYLFAYPITSQCYWFYECRTIVRVYCLDGEEGDLYIRYAECYSPAGAGDNCGQ